jgi:peptide/nickel transport system ATP-binding protein
MAEPLLQADGVGAHFKASGGAVFEALTAVDLAVTYGETLGVVGESGCGKSTLAKRLLGLLPGEGEVVFDGRRVDAADRRALRQLRRRMQYVFQDPLGSLDPRQVVLAQVREPLDIHGLGPRGDRTARARALLEEVGVGPHLLHRGPRALSGGQRQRVGLARALVLEPELLICDEPVSALDSSVQAQVLALLERLRDARGLTMLFISHDLAVIRHVSHRVAVLYRGRLVEEAPSEALFARPAHPYTRALLDAVPRLHGRRGDRLRLAGESSAPAAGRGCPFAPRCPIARPRCREEAPAFAPVAPGRRVACHLPFEIDAAARGPLAEVS